MLCCGWVTGDPYSLLWSSIMLSVSPMRGVVRGREKNSVATVGVFLFLFRCM